MDSKFALPAGSAGDALFEMRWRGEKGVIFGTVFDLKLPLRSTEALAGGQYKLATEHLFTFSGLKSGLVAEPSASSTLPENTINAGPFTAHIAKMSTSISGNRRISSATFDVKLTNTSDKPIILAYEGSSSYGVDDQGNRFGYGNPGGVDSSSSGIGKATFTNADPQFVLAPGESRNIQLSVMRRLGREVAGTKLSFFTALVQLEILPSKQIRTVRQYSLSFPQLTSLN